MSKNDITGDSLRSRELSPEGKANWDLIFPPARKGVCPTCNDDGRACAYPSENKPGCLHFPLAPYRPHENICADRKCTCPTCGFVFVDDITGCPQCYEDAELTELEGQEKQP